MHASDILLKAYWPPKASLASGCCLECTGCPQMLQPDASTIFHGSEAFKNSFQVAKTLCESAELDGARCKGVLLMKFP